MRGEALEGTAASDGIEVLQGELDAIIAGAAKGASAEEVGSRLKQGYVAAFRGIREARGDRGVLLRWLELPVVDFIDQQSGMRVQHKLQSAFSPGMVLSDLSIRQRGGQSWQSGGAATLSYRAEFVVSGSDVERVVIYSNGRVLRSMRMPKGRASEPRPIRIQGEAQGVITVVAHDAYGARPFSKSYAFYPRVRVFEQNERGEYQIGFRPGSARNSLDKFFLVGGSGRPTVRDPVISKF
jgi:hypothetical protein